MIYVPPILELSMFGVLDAGVPNRERVCLRPTDSVNLAQFGLLAAVQNEGGFVTPVPNLFFWFGDLTVSPPAWLIVFTGSGQPPPAPLVENGRSVYLFYWNLESVIFNIPRIVPVAFKLNTILIGRNVPHLSVKQIAEQ